MEETAVSRVLDFVVGFFRVAVQFNNLFSLGKEAAFLCHLLLSFEKSKTGDSLVEYTQPVTWDVHLFCTMASTQLLRIFYLPTILKVPWDYGWISHNEDLRVR